MLFSHWSSVSNSIHFPPRRNVMFFTIATKWVSPPILELRIFMLKSSVCICRPIAQSVESVFRRSRLEFRDSQFLWRIWFEYRMQLGLAHRQTNTPFWLVGDRRTRVPALVYREEQTFHFRLNAVQTLAGSVACTDTSNFYSACDFINSYMWPMKRLWYTYTRRAVAKG